MKIEENKELIGRMLQLTRMKATGRPRELAKKLSTSERSIYRLKDALLDKGLKIRYSRIIESYILD